MLAQLKNYRDALRHAIWETDLSGLPAWRVFLTGAARIVLAVIRDLQDGQLTLRAMSLVYTTLLALVPLLAVSFSVLKAFGVHNQIEPLLANLLTPLGPQGAEITSNIVNFVERVKVGVLGAIGITLLFYTVVSLMQKIESAFNYTWRVTQARSFQQRFSDYLSVLLIGPVLVFSAVGLTGSLMSNSFVSWLSQWALLGSVIEHLSRLVPYLLITIAFTFIYIFIPNTRVRVLPAVGGALVAGFLWETAGRLFASVVVSSTKYVAIYSAFAALIFFLIWLYVGWLILLIGANIAFYIQNPDYVVAARRDLQLSNHMKERLALSIMALIGRNYYDNKPGLTGKQMATALNIPAENVESVLKALESQRLITQSNSTPPTYLPARPLDEMTLADVLHSIRHAYEHRQLNPRQMPRDPDIDSVFSEMHKALDETFDQRTITDLVRKKSPDTLTAERTDE